VEFFVASSAEVAVKAADISAALRTAPRLTGVDGPLQFVNLGGSLIAAPGGEGVENAALCWDGHGIVGNRAFSSAVRTSFTAQSAETYINACLGSAQSSDMRGIFAFLRFNPNVKAYTICLDPLSQYPLYVCIIGETLMASTSSYLIEVAAAALGHKLTRTAKSGAFEAAFGLGAGDDTGYAEISFLPKDYMITCAGQNWRFVKSSLAGQSSGDYETLLDKSANRLTESVGAISNSFKNSDIVFDLTGGIDSRVVFSAAIAAGVKKPTIFSGGSITSADKCIAYALGQKFGASATDFPGNFDKTPITPLGIARRAVFRQQGCSNNFTYGLGTQRLKSFVRIRGGGGELLRTFVEPPKSSLFWRAPLQGLKKISRSDPVYLFILSAYWRSMNDKTIRAALPWAKRYCETPASHQRFYRHNFLSSGTKAVLAAIAKNGITPDTAAMDFYLADRCRRHFGYMSQGLNQTYAAFEPLFDPILVAAANALPIEERATGKLAFDLIERLGGKQMLKTPFAPHSMNRTMRKTLSRRLKVSERSLNYKSRRIVTLPTNQARTGGEPVIETESMPPSDYGTQAKTLWYLSSYFKALVKAIPAKHECWRYFDRKQLMTSLEQGDYFFRNETAAGRGLRILYTLMWVAGDTDPTGITKTH
jgi:hypothetical protein